MRRVRPAVAEIALAFAGMALGFLILGILAELGVVPRGGLLGDALGFVVGPAVTAIGAAFYAWASHFVDLATEERARAAPPRTGWLEALVWTAAGIAAALAGSWVLGQLMTQLDFPVVEQERIVAITEAARRGEATIELWALATSAVVLAPLAEEWMFRGLLFRRVLVRAGVPMAFALSSLAFATIHLNLAGFVIYTWLGLVFAETLRRTGRLWTAIAVHMGNNAFALSLLLIAPPNG
jgi:hypothetical protein